VVSFSPSASSSAFRSSRRRSYAPVVEYRYRVNGVDYVSRQIKLGLVTSASKAYATTRRSKIRWGSTGLLAVALGCFAIAARAAGLI